MRHRRLLLVLCLLVAAAAEEEEATQIVQGVTVDEEAVVQGVLEEEATQQDPTARLDLQAEHDQLALESQLEERDSAGHVVHAPAPGGHSGGGYNAPPPGDYGPPHPPKGGPRVPGPIPVPYAVPVRPGTVVLPQAPKGSGGYGGQGGGLRGQKGGHVQVGGHAGGHAAGGHGGGHGGGGHGRPRPVFKPRPVHGGRRPRPFKTRPAYGPPPKPHYGAPKPAYGSPRKPQGQYGAPSGGHATVHVSGGHSSVVHTSGGHSSGGHSSGGHSSGGHSSGGHSSGGYSSGGHSSGGHSSGGHSSGGHSSGGHSSGGHSSGGHSSGGHSSGGHSSGGHSSGGHSSGGHSSGGHSSGGHSAGGHSSGGHSSGGHSSGGHSSGGHIDSHASGAQHSGAYVAPPPVSDQSYSASQHESSSHQGGEVHSVSSSQSYQGPSQPEQSYSEPQAQALQSYESPAQPEEGYEAPAQLEQTYEPAPSHQVSDEYGAPEAQAQVSYEAPSSPAEEYGAPQENFAASGQQQSANYQESTSQEYAAPKPAAQEYGAPAAGGQEYSAAAAKAEAWPAPAADMPRIVSLDVQCDKSLMRVSVKFDRPFSGIIFSKGHYSNYNCIHLQPGSNSADSRFDISINSCGTTGNTDNGNYGYGSGEAAGSFFENTIIIQYDPQVQEVWDQARKLRCTWHNQYEKAVTFRPFPVDMLDVVRADFAGDNVGCWMQIQVGKGPWAAEVSGLVKIGQTMTMVLAIKDDDNKFDMLVRNCMAHDGKRAPIQLVDQAGCITRPKLMSKFTKIKNFGASASVLSYAHFQAFKFPDSMEVHFQCTIQICRYQCAEQCGSAIEPRVPAAGAGYEAPSSQDYNRVRRSVENQDVGIDRVIQVVSARDLAFTLESPAAGNDTETVVFPVEADAHRICMSTPGFAATLIVLLAILVISSLLSAFLCLRYRGFGSGDRSVLSAFENPIFLHKKTSHF